MRLDLLRTYHPQGTNGELWHNEELICYTIELPWRENERRISCIPEGSYVLQRRVSKKFGSHLLLLGVPNRDLILLHPANVALTELQGCISPVMALTSVGRGVASRKALGLLLGLVRVSFDAGEEVFLVVKERDFFGS